MIHYKNLYDLFFSEYPKEATDFLALTGYVGFEPIMDLKNLPMNSKIIFGLFKESGRKQLHDQLCNLHSVKTQILYPHILCHSKCYLWLRDGRPIKGMIGSANFSSNGLRSDYRESLFVVDQKQLFLMKGYIDIILDSTQTCIDYPYKEKITLEKKLTEYVKGVCTMQLYDTKTGETHNAAGLNWGMNSNNHTTPGDAYIPIRKEHIRHYKELFPPKQPKIQEQKRQNEVIEIVWDDGTIMQGLMEGTQEEDGIDYPKQISSSPTKNLLGKYIRTRLGIGEGTRITRSDLIKYGRDTRNVSLLEEGVYHFDFSPKK